MPQCEEEDNTQPWAPNGPLWEGVQSFLALLAVTVLPIFYKIFTKKIGDLVERSDGQREMLKMLKPEMLKLLKPKHAQRNEESMV